MIEKDIIEPLSEDFSYADINDSPEQKIVVSNEVIEALPEYLLSDNQSFNNNLTDIHRKLLVDWVALPKKLRNPKLVKDFCKKFDISIQFYNKMKRDADFNREVQLLRKRNLIDQSGEVLEALVNKAKSGDVPAIKLFYQYVEEFQEGTKHTVDGSLADLMREIGNDNRIK